MTQKYLVILFCIGFISFSSCVSKKKYLEMQAGRLTAEELSRKLDTENKEKAQRIEALIADYEAMKNELMESNAVKDDYIATLKKEAHQLSQDLNKKAESLEATSFNLDFEKQRLTEALNSKDNSIASLQSKVSNLESQLTATNSVIDQKNYDIGQLKEQAIVLEGKIKSSETKFADLQKQLKKSKANVDKVQTEMNEKNATITKLQNQVKLLKSQIGG